MGFTPTQSFVDWITRTSILVHRTVDATIVNLVDWTVTTESVSIVYWNNYVRTTSSLAYWTPATRNVLG